MSATGTPYICPVCGKTAQCGYDAHEEPLERRWLQRIEGEPSALNIMSALTSLIGAHQQDSSRRYGWPPTSVLQAMYLESEPDNEMTLELGTQLFRLRIEPIAPDEAERLRLRAISDSDQQDAAIRDGTYFPAWMMAVLKRARKRP